ncbi:MAG: transglycosylase domain-containing protein [Oscillospiraceae bacterium]|nr:transglycosylase domain-containing protein [Oscillospiraceae bacterium]
MNKHQPSPYPQPPTSAAANLTGPAQTHGPAQPGRQAARPTAAPATAAPHAVPANMYRRPQSGGGQAAVAARVARGTQGSDRSYRQDLSRLRRSLHRHVKGKPTHPTTSQTIGQQISRFIGRIVKTLLLLIVLLIVLGGGIGGGMLLAYIATTEPLTASQLNIGSQTTTMYDADDNVISISTGSENIDREYVSIADVKNTYIDEAFISIEDERFYENIGIDPRRIASAVVSALANGGSATHGGSTITQQTVKLITGEDERSAQRKVQEWYRAIQLKKELTDDEILELYLNLVPMANSYVGIQTAAQAYFGKDAADLSLAECAFLAGIPKSPSTYNPRTESGLRNALRRQRVVLGKMEELGYITESQYQEALNTELDIKRQEPDISGTSINSYFAEYVYSEVVEDLEDQLGYSNALARQTVYSGGLEIYTTLDSTIQSYVDETFAKSELFAAEPSRYDGLSELPQAGMAVIDNQTGAVVAMGGGSGTKTANLVTNRATDIERQPGSSIKPLNVYAPAIEMGLITGGTLIKDEEVYMDPDNPDEPYPKNAYYPEYRGYMTIRNAIKISNNVPAAKVLNAIGLDTSKYFLKLVGIDRTNDSAQLSMAMGGFEQGMSPLEMASAYTVFPNGGLYTPVYAYTQVLDSSGNVLLENKVVSNTVYSPETAFMMTKILEETILGRTSSFPYEGSASAFGMIKNANGETISTAGKTGTTDDDYDKWFVGFTPYYTAAVWYGFDTPRSIAGPDNEGAKRIWFDAMRNVMADSEAATWTQPGDIVGVEICVESGELATAACRADNPANVITEYYVKGSALIPTKSCSYHNGGTVTGFQDGVGTTPSE